MGAYESEATAEELIERRSESDDTLSFVVCLDEDDAPAAHPDEDETTPIGMVHAHNIDGNRTPIAY